jgi:class 3 adenylate cyclase
MINPFLRREPGIAEAIARLGKYAYAPELLSRLATYLRGLPAPQLDHIPPTDLGHALGLDEQATLELLVTAVHEGLCDLYWTAHCAQCNKTAGEWAHLAGARHETDCAGCGTRLELTLDQNLHVRFALNRRYRTGRLSVPAPARAQPLITPVAGTVTGLDLLSLQVFRDLLAGEVLLPDESLRVTRVALLFSDLRGSTALYARKGDPVAFGLVREHYGVIAAQVRAARGAVVKMVGDGMMASFADPAAGLRACLAIQQDLARFNQRRGLQGNDALQLKLGLHAGACLSVNLNGRMDYFGTAVNIAARVEGLATGDDVVTTAAVLAEAGARQVLDEARRAGAQVSEFATTLRGLEEAVQVVRITPRLAAAGRPAVPAATGA